MTIPYTAQKKKFSFVISFFAFTKEILNPLSTNPTK